MKDRKQEIISNSKLATGFTMTATQESRRQIGMFRSFGAFDPWRIVVKQRLALKIPIAMIFVVLQSLETSSGLSSLLVADEPIVRQARPADSPMKFEALELPERLTVGYSVRAVPLFGDERLDIAIVDSKRILVLENPTWRVHLLDEDKTKTDNVCFAWADMDSDGDLDTAVGADWTLDTHTGGTIDWLENPGQAGLPWIRKPIATEPTVHRMNWIDIDGRGTPSLFVLPLMGRETTKPHFAEAGVRFLCFKQDPQKSPTDSGASWISSVVNDDLHVAHQFTSADLDGDGRQEILIVSFEGVSLLSQDAKGAWSRTLLGTGEQTTTPNRGASEIRLGRFADGSPYLATVEPWHGDRISIYLPPMDADSDDPFQMKRPADQRNLWRRLLIDTQLKWGHAIATVNLDDDADEELVVGVRDDHSPENPCGVRIYDPVDANAGDWQVTRLDPSGVAVEDLVAADMDSDGRQDIVAVGRATHNIKIYFNRPKK